MEVGTLKIAPSHSPSSVWVWVPRKQNRVPSSSGSR